MDREQQARRSPFLVGATIFANFYLILFAVDAGLSLADEMLEAGGGGSLGALRDLSSGLLLLASVLVLLVAIFTPQLPKLILLPLVFFDVWVVVGAPPFMFSEPSTSVALAVVQVALIAAALLVNKLQTGGWLFSAGLLPHKGHLVLRTLVSFVVLGVLMPIAGIGLLIIAFASTIEQQTGGYLHFSSRGIEVRDTILRKGNKTVRLIGMVHVGEPKFYEDLYASFPPLGLVLAEGVTDRDGKLASSFSLQEGLAEVLGLKVQPQFAHPSGETSNKPRGDKPASREPISIPATAGRPRIIYADADVSDFSPTTIRFLGKVGELYGSSSFNELLERLSAISEQFTDADVNGVFEDILTKRNTRVLAEFDKRSGEYDAIVMPWGAQHMPGLEAALRARGFAIESQRMLPVARYRTIIDRLLDVMRRPQSSGTSFWYRQKMWIG